MTYEQIELSKATGSLAKYARELKDETVVLTVDKKPVAALMPLEEAGWETVALGTNTKFLRIIEESRQSLRKEGGVSSDEVRRRFGVKPRGSRRR